ncbi:hypothetical protein ACJJTC_014232 [Scirpophaga incertulas]
MTVGVSVLCLAPWEKSKDITSCDIPFERGGTADENSASVYATLPLFSTLTRSAAQHDAQPRSICLYNPVSRSAGVVRSRTPSQCTTSSNRLDKNSHMRDFSLRNSRTTDTMPTNFRLRHYSFSSSTGNRERHITYAFHLCTFCSRPFSTGIYSISTYGGLKQTLMRLLGHTEQLAPSVDDKLVLYFRANYIQLDDSISRP